jgi:hypothetical protein
MGFDEVGDENVHELLQSHSKKFKNEDLIATEVQHQLEKKRWQR